ncbi:MAG TPA: PhoU domain-containing protein [Methanomicrobiales archaeon]|nr:PhoU domain-containing protein [Methanomicrobiales archaeon]
MDIRKVQITGGASYSISLPKGWARAQGIRKNDPLAILIQEDGTLLITPKVPGVKVPRERNFDVSPSMDPVLLFRLLIAAYIGGYSVIRLTAVHRFPPFVRAVVRDFTRMTIGQEVAGETEASIIIKDLLNPVEMPLDRTISRMAVIVRSMHRDAMVALLTANGTLAEDVIARDNDVDRLHWLVARQFNLILSDPDMARSMKITPAVASRFYVLSRLIERIGDHGVSVAENAGRLMERRLEASEKDALSEAMHQALDLFVRSIDAFFTGNLEDSHRIIGMVAPLESRCSEMETLAQHHKGEITTALVSIIGSIRRLGEYAEDICENTMNHLVAEGKLEIGPASHSP